MRRSPGLVLLGHLLGRMWVLGCRFCSSVDAIAGVSCCAQMLGVLLVYEMEAVLQCISDPCCTESRIWVQHAIETLDCLHGKSIGLKISYWHGHIGGQVPISSLRVEVRWRVWELWLLMKLVMLGDTTRGNSLWEMWWRPNGPQVGWVAGTPWGGT